MATDPAIMNRKGMMSEKSMLIAYLTEIGVFAADPTYGRYRLVK